jgi:hypothetical protein
MTTYTLTAPEIALEALEVGLEKIATTAKELTPAIKAALMFVGGPLIGLALVIALPVIGLALAAYYSGKLIAARWLGIARYIKNVALFLAAPFIGLAYLLAFPFVGLGTLVYFGVKAARR